MNVFGNSCINCFLVSCRTVKKHVYVDPIEDVPTKYLTQAKGPLIHRDVCDGHVEPITEDNIFHTKIVRDSAKQIAKYRNIRGTVCKQVGETSHFWHRHVWLLHLFSTSVFVGRCNLRLTQLPIHETPRHYIYL